MLSNNYFFKVISLIIYKFSILLNLQSYSKKRIDTSLSIIDHKKYLGSWVLDDQDLEKRRSKQHVKAAAKGQG